jgi:hypothetical protein
LPLFAVFQPPCPQPEHAGTAQIPLVNAFDEDHHCSFAFISADLTFHESFPYHSY